MKRIKLKPNLKSKRIHLQQQKKLQIVDNIYSQAIIELKGKDRNEETALITLLEVYEQNKQTLPYNEWLLLNKYLPPNTNESIVIYDTKADGFNTIHTSFIFLQHHLLDTYWHGLIKPQIMWEGVSHFMILSNPHK